MKRDQKMLLSNATCSHIQIVSFTRNTSHKEDEVDITSLLKVFILN